MRTTGHKDVKTAMHQYPKLFDSLRAMAP